MTKHSVISISVFFLLAFGLTYAFSQLPPVSFYSVDINDILCGFGPLISGLVCYRIFKTETSFSISGHQPVKALSVLVISAITFMLTNTKSSFNYNLLFVLSQLIYCFGEEFGWRHYLQSATNKTNKWMQSLIIGTIWFLWHFSWVEEPVKAMTGQDMNAPISVLTLCAILILAIISLLFGIIMRKTQSVLLPTVLHFAAKANTLTLIVSLVIVIIAAETWTRLYFDKKTTLKPD